MGRPSSIRRLPPDLRERLEAWLRDKRLTQVEAATLLNEFLAERDLPQVSRRAVNRYARSMDKVGEKMRQSKEMADALDRPAGRGALRQGRPAGHLDDDHAGLRDQPQAAGRQDRRRFDARPDPAAARAEPHGAAPAAGLKGQRRARAADPRGGAPRGGRGHSPGGRSRSRGGSVSGDRLREIAREVYGVRR